jgi:lysophospholipase L1-like esterase
MRVVIAILPAVLIMMTRDWASAADPAAGAAAPSPIHLACIGDSITQGVGTDPKHSYPALLQDLLGSGYTVGNFGVGGTTLSTLGNFPYVHQGAWQQARDFHPRIAVIMLGTNDTKPGNVEHADTMKDDLEAMVRTLQALDSKPLVLVCLPCFIEDPGAYGIDEGRLTARIIPAIHRAADELKLTLIDIQAVTRDAATKDPILIPDRVHPNGDGYAIIAKTIQDAVVAASATLPK